MPCNSLDGAISNLIFINEKIYIEQIGFYLLVLDQTRIWIHHDPIYFWIKKEEEAVIFKL